MQRLIEGTPGQEAEVWVQDRGGGALRLRGTLVIEDLSDVLTEISSRTGANGPLNPVTQFMLSEASNHLAERLSGNDHAKNARAGHVPRLLSTALGHQPFVESVLGMSQHQMLRRWPHATSWYTDVIKYMLRPSRFLPTFDSLHEAATAWSTGTLGEFVRRFADHALGLGFDQTQLRVAEALQLLWPDYEPMRDAIAAYRHEVGVLWQPMYFAALRAYGLVLRPGIDPDETAWAMNSMNSREFLERLAGFTLEHTDAAGNPWTLTGWNTLVILAGVCTDEDGSPVNPFDLETRLPVRPITFDV